MNKILLLDFNIAYINNTKSLLIKAMQQTMDVLFFGPGYVSDEDLQNGVINFVEKQDNIDIIAATEHIFVSCYDLYNIYTKFSKEEQKLYMKKLFGKHMYCENVNFDIFVDTLHIFKKFLENIQKPKIWFLFETDVYMLPQKFCDFLYNSNGYIASTIALPFVKAKKNYQYLAKEDFYSKVNDNWYNLLKKIPCKVISLPHFIDSSEFGIVSPPLSIRPKLALSLGVQYWARKVASSEMKKHGMKRGYNIHILVYKLLYRLGVNLWSKLPMLAYYQRKFMFILLQHKYLFTCGSGLDWPIRKFFEIPAAGAVLIAKPFTGFEQAGFKHLENCYVTEPENVVEAVEYLEAHPIQAQQIANAGRNLIYEKHSVDARSKQLEIAFRAIINNQFNGTHWENGNFHVITKNGS